MTLPLARAVAFLALASATVSSLQGQVTESPQTVAPGRVLVEMDGLRLSLDREDGSGVKYSALGVASTLVSAGLTDFLDVQAGVDLFWRERIERGGERESHSGLGDMRFRMKWTVWRNAALGAALAVIPYVKIPSSTGGVGNNAWEGGVIFPWAAKLPGGVVTGAMLRMGRVRNDADDGYDSEWLASGFAQFNATSAFSLYGEATVEATSAGSSRSAGTLGVGALLQVTRSIQLDYELQRGLNSRASAWTHVLRVNWGW